MKTNRFDEILRDAIRTKERFRLFVEELRQDATRSPQGRAQLMADEHSRVSNKIASLREEYQQEIVNQRAMLERSAFAHGNIDYHNAVEKVSEMDSN